MNPPSPTARNKPLGFTATLVNHFVVPAERRFQSAPVVLVYTAPLSPTATMREAVAATPSSQSVVGGFRVAV